MPQSIFVEPAALECEDEPSGVDIGELTPRPSVEIACDDTAAARNAKETGFLEAVKAHSRKLLACATKPTV